MSGRFTLSIDLSNDDMQTPGDIAGALAAAAMLVSDGRTASRIRDINGNTVGEWAVTS